MIIRGRFLSGYLHLFSIQVSERRECLPDPEEIISTTLRLIARLELDRQDTIESLCQERVRVQQLGDALDEECRRRLDLLEVAVQKGKFLSSSRESVLHPVSSLVHRA